jgi:uncharacterized membrane protein
MIDIQQTPRIFKSYLLKIGIGGFFAFVVVLFAYFYNFDYRGDFSPSNGDWGTFGDYVGGILNPILGFLSFCALLVTIWFQYSTILETRLEVERNNKRSAATDFLVRFEKQEENLHQLVIDIARNYCIYIETNDVKRGESKFKRMLESYSKGDRNIFLNLLKRFFIVENDKVKIHKLMNFADCRYGCQVEQYVNIYQSLLNEAKELDEKLYKLIKFRATAKLYDAMKNEHDAYERDRKNG